MKKTFLSLILGIGLVLSVKAQITATNSAAWTPPITATYTNITYNIAAATPSVTVAQLGNGPSLPVVGNGIISAISTTSTTVPVSTVLPTATTFGGSYVLWVQAVGTSGGVLSAANWVSLSFSYTPPPLPSVTNLHLQ